MKIEHLYRYDTPENSEKIMSGSLRITTLDACRKAELHYFGDEGEGTKTTTSVPGVNYPDNVGLAKMLGCDPAGISISGNAVCMKGENAVVRKEKLPDAYVFCTSYLENNKHMLNTFGSGQIKISNLQIFFRIVDAELRKSVSTRLGNMLLGVVEYAPRINNYRDHTQKHIGFIKPANSSKQFDKEAEVRALWIPENPDIRPLNISNCELKAFVELV